MDFCHFVICQWSLGHSAAFFRRRVIIQGDQVFLKIQYNLCFFEDFRIMLGISKVAMREHRDYKGQQVQSPASSFTYLHQYFFHESTEFYFKCIRVLNVDFYLFIYLFINFCSLISECCSSLQELPIPQALYRIVPKWPFQELICNKAQRESSVFSMALSNLNRIFGTVSQSIIVTLY